MSYTPKFLSPEDTTLDLEKFIQERYWHKVPFRSIRAKDRVLVIRIANGTRMTVEGVVRKYDYGKGAWLNSLGTPVVSVLDTYIFKAGASPDDQSEETSELMLGG